MVQDSQLSLMGHLDELRKRLFYSVIAILVGFAFCYFFKEQLFEIITAPINAAIAKLATDGSGGSAKLVFLGLPEAFFTLLKAAFFGGLILSTPVWLYQFWKFISPGLYEREKKLILPVVFLTSIFFIGGALFGYFVVFPFAFDFFLSYTTPVLEAQLSMKLYFDFAIKLLLAFGFSFELPIVLTFLVYLGAVKVDFLTRNRKYAILAIFIFAAIITPPDVISQVFLAVPMCLLYELGIIGGRLAVKRKNEKIARSSSLD